MWGPFNLTEIPGSMTKWRRSESLTGLHSQQCAAKRICMLYLQIAVLGTALHWINIQLISDYTLILQQWLIHAGLLSGGKLSMSRTPAEALGADQDTGQICRCFVCQWAGFSLLCIIMSFSLWNNWLIYIQRAIQLFCICLADAVESNPVKWHVK